MRLIDADELVRNILSQTIMNETDAKIMDRYLYCINNQPTAYVVRKNVDELENTINNVFEFLKTKRDKKYMKVNFDDLEIRIYKEQLKAGAKNEID